MPNCDKIHRVFYDAGVFIFEAVLADTSYRDYVMGWRVLRFACLWQNAKTGVEAYLLRWRVSALLVQGCIPVALSNSEGAGSVRIVVRLPGAHLYKQVLGN